jgi:hypothetical protein
LNRFLLINIFILFINFCTAQECLNDIDLTKIPYKEVRELIISQKKSKVECISDIKSSCSQDFNCNEYYKQIRSYHLDKSLRTVWENYNGSETQKAYNSNKFSLGLMLCKKNVSEKILYPNSSFGRLDTGQVIYLKLKFLRGLLKMAVAFEINKIDTTNKTIEFSYVNGGKSRGKQILEFKENNNHKTSIIHTTFYRSKSKVRDLVFYPFFHSRVTREFHKNFKRILCQAPNNLITSN